VCLKESNIKGVNLCNENFDYFENIPYRVKTVLDRSKLVAVEVITYSMRAEKRIGKNNNSLKDNGIKSMEYNIYHDESQEAGYWHGLLFVPQRSNSEIISFLKNIRKQCGYGDYQRLNFKGLKSKGKQFRAIRMSLQLFVLLLRRDIKMEIDGNTGNTVYDLRSKHSGINCEPILMLNKIYGVKFILLKEKNAHNKMEHYVDHTSKIETTFRFALKGGCYFMFDYSNPISIEKIFFDGHQHYGRHIDKYRIIKNLQSEFRSYCTINSNFGIDDRQLRNRKDNSFIMMNFIDSIVSAWRCLISKTYSNIYQRDVIQPLHNLFKRWQENKILKNSHSRWFQCFSLSECWIEKSEWHFSNFGLENNAQGILFES